LVDVENTHDMAKERRTMIERETADGHSSAYALPDEGDQERVK
jgi:hypothetical protein